MRNQKLKWEFSLLDLPTLKEKPVFCITGVLSGYCLSKGGEKSIRIQSELSAKSTNS